MDYARFLKQNLTLGFIALVLTGCATVKVPNYESGKVVVEDDEKRLVNHDVEFIERLDKSDFIYNDASLEDFLNKIAQRLMPPEAAAQGLNISLKMIKDPDLNAFALTEGRIYIHTGIIAAADTEDQLAALIGHEMTHVLHRHILKQSRSLKNTTAWWTGVGVITGGIGMIVSELATISSISGFSQDLEKEADRNSFYLTRQAGYNPCESVKMFEALRDYMTDEQEREPYFFSSHPHIQQRINNFKEELIQNGVSCAQEAVVDKAYDQRMLELRLDNLFYGLDKGLFKTVEKELDRLMGIYPAEPRLLCIKGELYRQRQDVPKSARSRDKARDYQVALEGFTKAFEMDHTLLEALGGKGRVLYLLGRKDEAREALKEYLRLEPQAKDRSFIEHMIN